MRLYEFNPDFQVSSIEAVRSGPRRPKKNDRLRPLMLRASLWRWGWRGTRSAEPTSWRLAGKCCARFGTMERIEPSWSDSQWEEIEFGRIAATLSLWAGTKFFRSSPDSRGLGQVCASRLHRYGSVSACQTSTPGALQQTHLFFCWFTEGGFGAPLLLRTLDGGCLLVWLSNAPSLISRKVFLGRFACSKKSGVAD